MTESWNIDVAASGAGYKSQKVSFLEGSDFLVGLSMSDHGVMRVKLSDQTSAIGSLSSYLPSGLGVQDLEVVRDSLYALFTFTGWHQIFVFNMQSLKVVKRWSFTGLIAYMDKSPENMVAAIANEQKVSPLKFNFPQS